MFMSTLHMCGCRMNKLFHFDVGFLSTCVCQLCTYVDVEWTNCFILMCVFFQHVYVNFAHVWMLNEQIVSIEMDFLSTCLCRLCTCVDVKWTNKLFHSTWIFFQHVYVDVAYMCGCWTNKLFHSTWIFFPCSFNMCSWDVKWVNLFCISILM